MTNVDWACSRVLVTGGAGFLGSFLCERLRERGVKELVVPRSKDCDLVDGSSVRRLLSGTRPEIVLHLAAHVGGIRANQENPATFFYENAMMGIQLMHESWKNGARKFVAVGTVCAYPKLAAVPFSEDDLWSGYPERTNAPYGVAKKILSVQSHAYRDQHGFDSIVVYPTNLYGPRDNFDLASGHVIPSMLRRLHEAKLLGQPEVALWGDGSPTRDFLFVADCAEGIILAAELYSSSDPLNLGSGDEVPIRSLAEKSAALVGYTGRITWDTSKPNGQPRRAVDTTRAKRALGFECRVSLEEGLCRTYQWYLTQGQRQAPF